MSNDVSKRPRIASREARYQAVLKYDRRIKGLDPDPRDVPYDGPKCRHENPLGNCFDCEG